MDSNKPVTLNWNKIPEKFRVLIPLAEQWGIPDAVEREQAIDAASYAEIEELVTQMKLFDESLDEWLADPEAEKAKITREYVAFSAMRLAGDMAWLILERGQENTDE